MANLGLFLNLTLAEGQGDPWKCPLATSVNVFKEIPTAKELSAATNGA